MSLFKIFKGKENNLSTVPCHEGYAYFTEDTGNLFIDVTSSEGGRVQVNAYAAQILRKKVQDTGEIKEIDIDDILLNDAITAVSNGGTGKDTLTINALLVGNGTDPVKMVALDTGSIAVGDSTNGVAGLKGKGILYDTTANGGSPQFGTAPVEVGGTGKVSFTTGTILKGNGAGALQEITGTGVLYAATANAPRFGTAPVQVGGTGKASLTSGAILKGNGTGAIAEISGTGVLFASSNNNPQFGVAPLTGGGTGANNASDARTNLSVYSKQEVDNKTATAITTVYNTTLFPDGWLASEGVYTYNYVNNNLKCGSNGNVPPIITYASNQEEYSQIQSAVATKGTGIIFTITKKPTSDISIIIIDIG